MVAPEIEIEKHPNRRGYLLTTEQLLPSSREEVFAFFSDAFQLEAITPPWLNFHVVTPAPIQMAAGTLIDYRLKLHSLPVNWRTRIRDWDPPKSFVDEQIKGPYRRWVHEHTFEPHAEGTLVKDQVEYEVPGGWLMHALVVRRDLRRIFSFRHQALSAAFHAT